MEFEIKVVIVPLSQLLEAETGQNKGPVKTPKRLKPVLPLLEKMIWRHAKCGYKPLRDKVCPSKVAQST